MPFRGKCTGWRASAPHGETGSEKTSEKLGSKDLAFKTCGLKLLHEIPRYKNLGTHRLALPALEHNLAHSSSPDDGNSLGYANTLEL
jgi:hypothetical protein